MHSVMVIGLGSMGRRRIRLMKNLYAAYKIFGVDLRADRRETVCKQFDIEVFASIDDVLQKHKVDCSFVCSSPLSHADIIYECLSRNLHVFSELNLVPQRYMENIALSDKKGLILFLSSTQMYKQEMQYIIEKVTQVNKRVHYIYHVGQYLPDWHPWENIKDFFVGDKRTNGCREFLAIELPWLIQAFGDIEETNAVSDKLTSLNIEYNDSYLIQLSHKNGSKGMLAVDVVSRKATRRLEVYHENLFIEWNGVPESLKVIDIEKNTAEYPCKNGNYYVEKGYCENINEQAYVDEILNFFDVIEKKTTAQYSFKDDMNVLKVIDNIFDNS